jgi:hypothetical protein
MDKAQRCPAPVGAWQPLPDVTASRRHEGVRKRRRRSAARRPSTVAGNKQGQFAATQVHAKPPNHPDLLGKYENGGEDILAASKSRPSSNEDTALAVSATASYGPVASKDAQQEGVAVTAHWSHHFEALARHSSNGALHTAIAACFCTLGLTLFSLLLHRTRKTFSSTCSIKRLDEVRE